ncbi:MAG: class I SAM-dependent rRNA methyltransferase [Myxococcales bacterium]|nr:class I SAM-dependent rRNA methyltransferase [Myxococcales bacterium]
MASEAAGRRRFPRWARYQLRKEAVGVVLRGVPWIFRDHLSSAAEVFGDGQGLRLVDGANRVLGHGVYEAHGAIAIRVLRTGAVPPDAAWLAAQVDAALARRAALRGETDAFRALHGEADGVPAVVVDVFGSSVVVQSYSAGADALARLAGRMVAARLGQGAGGDDAAPATSIRIAWKPAQRRQGAPSAARWLRGAPAGLPGERPEVASSAEPAKGEVAPAGAAQVAGELVRFREGELTLCCEVLGGQKSGAYLDLRGLRRAVAAMPLAGERVLNLFSYSGMLGRAAEHAGASEVWQVDASEAALALAAQHHMADPSRFRSVVADVFDWLPKLSADERFGLVIVDPPSMTSRRAQVPQALAAYRRLYRAAARHVAPGGTLVAACCTSRITRPELRQVVAEALGGDFVITRELPPEPDHPVTFAEADYLKVMLWRRRPAAS